MDCDTAGSKQEKCDEISNEMKSMLIKICLTKDFIEMNTRPGRSRWSDEVLAEQRCSLFSHSNDRESRIVVRQETRARAMQVKSR